MTNKTTKKQRIVRSLITILSLLMFVGFLLMLYFLLDLNEICKTPEDLKNWFLKKSTFGIIFFFLIQVLQVTFIPIPSFIPIIAGSLVYGPLISFLVGFLGTIVGSIIAFAIGRVFGKRLAYWIYGKETIDDLLEKTKGRENIVILLMFILPIFPDDIIALVAGMTSMSWKFFMIATLAGRPWSILLTSFFMTGNIIPFKGWGIYVWIAIILLIVLAVYIVHKNKTKFWAFVDKMNEMIDNPSYKKKEK